MSKMNFSEMLEKKLAEKKPKRIAKNISINEKVWLDLVIYCDRRKPKLKPSKVIESLVCVFLKEAEGR